MNIIAKMLGAFFLCMQINSVHADTQKVINYENQRGEVFDLENWLKEIQYKTEEVKDTCHKQVPYEEKVCKDVTKYKDECQTIPAHESCNNVNHPICRNETTYEDQCTTPTHRECHNESERVCHNETRYENVCSTSPDRQECRTVNEPYCHNETRYENQCRTVPGQQECRVVTRYREECQQTGGGRQCRQIPPDIRCRVVNGENKCEKIPGREECTEGRGQRVCRQVPYEERECHQGSSRQECRQVPRQEQVCENRSRQECRTVPGREECRQVPRTEQVCGMESRQVCQDVQDRPVCHKVPRTEQVCEDHWEIECRNIPAEQVCKKVPYTEQVCSMENRMKDVPYECTKQVQVPHEVIVKTHKANVQMEFDARSPQVETQFNVSLDTKGALQLTAKADRDSHVIAFAQKEIKHEEVANVNSISALYKIILFDQMENFKFIESGIQNIKLHKRSLSFVIDGKIETKRASLDINISKKSKVKFAKTVLGNSIASTFDGEKTTINIDLEKLGAPKLGGIFTDLHRVHLKLKLDYKDLGEVILSEGKELSTETNVEVNVD